MEGEGVAVTHPRLFFLPFFLAKRESQDTFLI